MGKLSAWIAGHGREVHTVIGALYTVLFLHWTAPLALVAQCLVLGLVHEQAERDAQGRLWSDFLRANGGPWNGIKDVLAFLPAPVASWIGYMAYIRFFSH